MSFSKAMHDDPDRPLLLLHPEELLLLLLLPHSPPLLLPLALLSEPDDKLPLEDEQKELLALSELADLVAAGASWAKRGL